VDSDLQTIFDTGFGSTASLAPSYLDDRMEATTINLHLTDSNWQIGMDSYFKRDTGVGAGATQIIDHQGYDNYDQYLFTIAYNNNELLQDWQLSTNFSYYYSDGSTQFNIFPATTVLPVGNDGNLFTPHNGVDCPSITLSDIGCVTQFPDGVKGQPGMKSKIPTINIIGSYDGWEDHTWRFNLGGKKESAKAYEKKNFGAGVINGTEGSVDGSLTDVTGSSFIYLPNKNRTVGYLSIQDIWELNTILRTVLKR
jgi:iron complex outermembrane receptor protein